MTIEFVQMVMIGFLKALWQIFFYSPIKFPRDTARFLQWECHIELR